MERQRTFACPSCDALVDVSLGEDISAGVNAFSQADTATCPACGWLSDDQIEISDRVERHFVIADRIPFRFTMIKDGAVWGNSHSANSESRALRKHDALLRQGYAVIIRDRHGVEYWVDSVGRLRPKP